MSKSPQVDGLLFSALFNERGVLASLVVSQVVAIVLAFAPNVEGDIWLRLGIISLFLHLIVLVSTSSLYFCRFFLQKRTQTFQLSLFFVFFLLSTCIFSILFSHFAFDIDDTNNLIYFTLRNCIIVALLTALFVQFLLIYFEKEQQTKALARAELDESYVTRILTNFSDQGLIELDCCDGSEDASKRIARVLHNDPATGVIASR